MTTGDDPAVDIVAGPARCMLDANILLSASDPRRPTWTLARAILNEWPKTGTVLYASSQVTREYLAVATRPLDANGLGFATSDALRNIAAFRDRIEILNESNATLDRLLDLVSQTACSGKQVHDANIVATMLTHGVPVIVTDNVKDFARFGDHIEVIPLR